MKLGPRHDIAAKEKVDRSGLSQLDWQAIAVENAFRGAHFLLEDAAERSRKLGRLDTLLDDPDLATTHEPNHPDRLAAITRHAELNVERHRFTTEGRRGAMVTARLWEKLPSTEWQVWLRDGLALAFFDSGLFLLASNDPALYRMRFWKEALATWRNREGKTLGEPPF